MKRELAVKIKTQVPPERLRFKRSIACVRRVAQVDRRIRRAVRSVEVENLRLVVLQNKSERNKEFEDDFVRLGESRTVGIDVFALSLPVWRLTPITGCWHQPSNSIFASPPSLGLAKA